MRQTDTLPAPGASFEGVRAAELIPFRPFAGACLAVLSMAAVVACSTPEPGPERIVLIVVDTLRRDHVSAYGNGDLTPRIGELAARGQVLTHARAAFHQTTMSMSSLFTGRTPSLETNDPAKSLSWNGETWCGMARFASGNRGAACIPDALTTLGERMRQAGYWTIGIPSNQFMFGAAGFSRGFDDWVEVGSPDGPIEQPREERRRLSELRSWAPVTQATIEALGRRPRDRFFLFVHFMDVHDYHYTRVEYPRAVRVLDSAVGVLLDELEARGLLENATVILTSDHGERLREVHGLRGRPAHYGNPSFEEVLKIPLIIAPPLVEDPAAPVRTQDLHHLLRTLAGERHESGSELATGEHYLSERWFRTYFDGRWKSTVRRRDGRLFLFDLDADPGETVDIAPQNPELAQAHQRRIDELTRALAVQTRRGDRELSDEERRALEALGYVE